MQKLDRGIRWCMIVKHKLLVIELLLEHLSCVMQSSGVRMGTTT